MTTMNTEPGEREEAPRAKWDQAGLKDACQRGLAMGRTHQKFDLQLLLDMLLEIERLESLLYDKEVARRTGAGIALINDAATRMRERCAEELRALLEREVNGHCRGAYGRAIVALESLTLDGEKEQ